MVLLSTGSDSLSTVSDSDSDSDSALDKNWGSDFTSDIEDCGRF